MSTCEALLVAVLIVLNAYSSQSDLKRGIVPNKLLLSCVIATIPINIIYYAIWAREFLPLFCQNLLLLSMVSLLLYACNVWAAGDSKLLIVGTLCIPGRFLTFWDVDSFPGFVIILIAFSLAYLFVIGETIVLELSKREPSPRRPKTSISNGPRIAASFLFAVGVVGLTNTAFQYVAPRVLPQQDPMLLALDFCIVILANWAKERLDTKALLALGAACCVANMSLSGLLGLPFLRLISPRIIITVIVMSATVFLATRHNYQVIPTNSVQAGNILSVETVLEFAPSRVKGLPTYTTEDMRSRISEGEAQSIRRWETSAYGRPTITIVRKIPFALFISLGFFLFLATEMVMQWH